jgi:hypothetical protein
MLLVTLSKEKEGGGLFERIMKRDLKKDFHQKDLV